MPKPPTRMRAVAGLVSDGRAESMASSTYPSCWRRGEKADQEKRRSEIHRRAGAHSPTGRGAQTEDKMGSVRGKGWVKERQEAARRRWIVKTFVSKDRKDTWRSTADRPWLRLSLLGDPSALPAAEELRTMHEISHLSSHLTCVFSPRNSLFVRLVPFPASETSAAPRPSHLCAADFMAWTA